MTDLVDDNFDDLIAADPYKDVPAEMKREPRWLVWRMEPTPSGTKGKIPYDPKTGRKANDEKFGVPYEVAIAAAKDYSGVGFYTGGSYICVDIDNCIDGEGNVAPFAADILREMNSFTEVSPSGKGLHIWAKGVKPGDACRRGIEIYSTKHYITVTGYHVEATPKEVRDVDITPIYNRMLAGEFQESEKKSEPSVSTTSVSKTPPQIQSSGKVITDKLHLFMTGTIVFNKPFVIEDEFGNSITYPSQSEADSALAALLARKYDGDAEKIDSDFRISSLYRAKWDRQDYRDRTIKSAISFLGKEKILAAPMAPTPATPAQAVAQIVEETKIVETEDKLPEFPTFVGSLHDLCDAMSPDIPYPFKFSAAITCMGLIRSGLDTLEVEPHIQPRFYTALIAEPGRGKTAAINEVTKIMKGLTDNYRTFSSIDSGPALVDAFYEQVTQGIAKTEVGGNLSDSLMSKILLSPDEIKGLFEKAKITAGSRNSMQDELLKLFESNATGNRSRNVKSKINLENAHLGVLGGATIEGYAAMWTGTSGSSGGLQSRVIPIGIPDRKMPSAQRQPNAEKLAIVIPRLIMQAKKNRQFFRFSKEAFELFDLWWSAKGQSNPSETRMDGIVKRLLIILANTNDVDTIEPELVQQAIDFGDFIIACRNKYNPLDASTWAQQFENLIIGVHQKYGDLTKNDCRRMVHPERKSGGVGPFNQAHGNLVQSGILKQVGESQRAPVFRVCL